MRQVALLYLQKRGFNLNARSYRIFNSFNSVSCIAPGKCVQMHKGIHSVRNTRDSLIDTCDPLKASTATFWGGLWRITSDGQKKINW